MARKGARGKKNKNKRTAQKKRAKKRGARSRSGKSAAIQTQGGISGVSSASHSLGITEAQNEDDEDGGENTIKHASPTVSKPSPTPPDIPPGDAKNDDIAAAGMDRNPGPEGSTSGSGQLDNTVKMDGVSKEIAASDKVLTEAQSAETEETSLKPTSSKPRDEIVQLHDCPSSSIGEETALEPIPSEQADEPVYSPEEERLMGLRDMISFNAEDIQGILGGLSGSRNRNDNLLVGKLFDIFVETTKLNKALDRRPLRAGDRHRLTHLLEWLERWMALCDRCLRRMWKGMDELSLEEEFRDAVRVEFEDWAHRAWESAELLVQVAAGLKKRIHHYANIMESVMTLETIPEQSDDGSGGQG